MKTLCIGTENKSEMSVNGLDTSINGQFNVVINKLKSILVSITSNMKFNL